MNGIVTITNGAAVAMAGETATIIVAMASVGVMVGAMTITGVKAGAATIADAETVAGIAGAGVLGASALRDEAAYFRTPVEIEGGKAAVDEPMRLGGMVAAGSIIRPTTINAPIA